MFPIDEADPEDECDRLIVDDDYGCNDGDDNHNDDDDDDDDDGDDDDDEDGCVRVG